MLRLVKRSSDQYRAWTRLNLGALFNHVPNRSVQEFPNVRLDNTSPRDHFLVLPESFDNFNELLRLPKIREPEINFNKIDVETAFKGLSQAICKFEDFLIDRETEMVDPYKNPEDMLRDLERHLFPMDTAYNLLMVMICVNSEKYLYNEINILLSRYYAVREKRFAGIFWNSIKQFNFTDTNLDKSDERLLNSYRWQINCPTGKRPVDDSTLLELKKNLKNDTKEFGQCLYGANSLIAHTVDDPDILAAVANQYIDCQELHHKERTPLKVTATTFKKFMKVCPDRFVRQRLWEVYNKRCSPKALPRYNTSSLQTSIRIARRKIADLCGYRSHLDFRLRNSMAQTKENILVSLNSINQDNIPKLNDRLQELTDFADDNNFADSNGLQEYDLDYWTHKFNYEVLIGLNKHQVATYFPLSAVLKGIHNFIEQYLSIEIKVKKQERDRLWSSDVQVFELKRNGQLLGNINFDPFQNGTRGVTSVLYARMRTKYPGESYVPTRLISAPYRIDPSTGAAHLEVIDAVNLFHCFIVVLQRLLYNYKYYELNIHGVLEHDVLNLLPHICDAHLLSNPKLMQSFSDRGQSKPIDSQLASSISKSFYYFRPLEIWNQLYRAHLDLEMHSVMASAKNIVEETYKIYSPFERFPENYDYCAMSDIFVGPNDGIKYADLWARQLATTCLSKLTDPDNNLDDEKMKKFYSILIDNFFTPNDLETKFKLLSPLCGNIISESTKSGLGVL